MATSEATPGQISRILAELHKGGLDAHEATDRLFELIYPQLRQAASGLMRAERRDHTLQPTALVNEAYLRISGSNKARWQSRTHFLAVAARAMRRILVDYARRHGAAKRGGGWQRVTLDDGLGLGQTPDLRILDLERALTRLSGLDSRMGQIAELRLFGGMTVEEVAQHLKLSVRAVHGDWHIAKIWLARELTGETVK